MATKLETAFARLERAGAEFGRTTQKLCDAADQVGREIARRVVDAGFEGAPLPCGWSASSSCNHTDHSSSACPSLAYTLTRHDPQGNIAERVGGLLGWADRDSALLFARHIADGWLARVCELLEEELAKNTAATATITGD